MKKTILFSLIIGLASMAFAEYSKGYSFADPTYCYKMDADGNLSYAKTIDAGQELSIDSTVIVPATVGKKANKYEYIKIDDGEELWIFAKPVVRENDIKTTIKPGVIVRDTNVYTFGDRATVENFQIKAGTIVGLAFNGSGKIESGLRGIYFYDTNVFWKTRLAYVYEENISVEADDLEAVSLAKSALSKDPQTERGVITKLLSSAQKKAVKVKDYIAEIEAKIDGKDITQSATEEFGKSGTINSDGSKVNVRDTPGKNGKQVGQIPDGCRVSASKRTVMQEKIAGETDSWYFIATPGEDSVEGWVFGSSIKWE